MLTSSQITEDKWKILLARMVAAGIRPQDLEEKFVRSSGPGGQYVNKVAACVCLVHRPSGLAVKCQRSREQGANRYWARTMLLAKWERTQEDLARRTVAIREKERRQRRKRSRQGKEKMLANKKMRAQIKKDRQAVRWPED